MAILEVNENQKQMLFHILMIKDKKLKSKDKIGKLGNHNLNKWVTDVEDIRDLMNQLKSIS